MSFRDDIVYLVFLYQRFFLYPIDSTRVNEYGYCPAATEATADDDRGAVKDLTKKTKPAKESKKSGHELIEGAKEGQETKKEQ